MTLTVGSLFSGIGGIDLGLERAGMTVRWQAETDPYASRVLAKHWPDVPNLGDVTKIDWSTVERPDLICAGFPCQPVSTAGRRRGQADERWLWPEVARCLRDLGPRWALLENVPGLLVRGMGDVLGDLAACGYDAEWQSIPAAAVGAPHLRYRVFVVAHASSGRGPDGGLQPGRQEPRSRGKALAYANRGRCPQRDQGQRDHLVFDPERPIKRDDWWSTEPDVGRLVDGLSPRLARSRLTVLGNAVVPQVAEFVGRALAAHIECSPDAGTLEP